MIFRDLSTKAWIPTGELRLRGSILSSAGSWQEGADQVVWSTALAQLGKMKGQESWGLKGQKRVRIHLLHQIPAKPLWI